MCLSGRCRVRPRLPPKTKDKKSNGDERNLNVTRCETRYLGADLISTLTCLKMNDFTHVVCHKHSNDKGRLSVESDCRQAV